MTLRPHPILRSPALRTAVAAMTLAVVAVGGDLSVHANHVDVPPAASAHDSEAPLPGAPGHDTGTPTHHSCGVHVCFHQLQRSRSPVRLRTASGVRTHLPDRPSKTDVLFVSSLDRPPRDVS